MRNHYVPQFLLRQWVKDSDKKLESFRVDIKGLPSNRQAPIGTGYEDNLFALSRDQVAGMTKHAIEESLFRVIDNDASLVLQKLCTQKLSTLNPKEDQDWVRFLMSLRTRQPKAITSIIENSDKNFRKELSKSPEEYKQLAGEEDPQTLEEWTEGRFPGLIENFGMALLDRLIDNPSIGTKIIGMTWWVWDFSDLSNHLLLADNPCIFTTGIDSDDLVIALPISPHQAFIATKSERVSKIIRNQSTKSLLTKINESSVAQANTRIYALDDSPRKFILNRLKEKTGS